MSSCFHPSTLNSQPSTLPPTQSRPAPDAARDCTGHVSLAASTSATSADAPPVRNTSGGDAERLGQSVDQFADRAHRAPIQARFNRRHRRLAQRRRRVLPDDRAPLAAAHRSALPARGPTSRCPAESPRRKTRRRSSTRSTVIAVPASTTIAARSGRRNRFAATAASSRSMPTRSGASTWIASGTSRYVSCRSGQRRSDCLRNSPTAAVKSLGRPAMHARHQPLGVIRPHARRTTPPSRSTSNSPVACAIGRSNVSTGSGERSRDRASARQTAPASSGCCRYRPQSNVATRARIDRNNAI